MQGEITFTFTYLLHLRLCFGELPYQLRIRFVPGSVPFEESEKHLVCKKCFFPMETNRGFLAEHLVCKNVQPWLRVSFASTSQPPLYLVPYTIGLDYKGHPWKWARNHLKFSFPKFQCSWHCQPSTDSLKVMVNKSLQSAIWSISLLYSETFSVRPYAIWLLV